MTDTVVFQTRASKSMAKTHLYIPCTESVKNFPHLRPGAAALCMIPLVLAVAPPRLRLSGGTERLPKSILPPMLTCTQVLSSVWTRTSRLVVSLFELTSKSHAERYTIMMDAEWADLCCWARFASSEF